MTRGSSRSLEGLKVLVLNSSFEPIRIVCWQRAMALVVGAKVEVLDHYPDRFVRSVSQSFPLPAVIRLNRYLNTQKIRPRMRLTRHHVFARDDFRCQYCREVFGERELTLDHVVPLVQGGRSSWSNLVACCVACNQKKGPHTPQQAGLQLYRVPREPQLGFVPDLIFYRGALLPEAWKPFVLPGLERIA